MSGELKIRASIQVGPNFVVLEPYSDGVYRLEINGTAESVFTASAPPLNAAVSWIAENKDFDAKWMSSLEAARNWTFVDIDTSDPTEEK